MFVIPDVNNYIYLQRAETVMVTTLIVICTQPVVFDKSTTVHVY